MHRVFHGHFQIMPTNMLLSHILLRLELNSDLPLFVPPVGTLVAGGCVILVMSGLAPVFVSSLFARIVRIPACTYRSLQLCLCDRGV